MGQQKGALVFDPASGRGVTMDEANAIISRGGLGRRDEGPQEPAGANYPMTMFSPGPLAGDAQDVAVDLPPMERDQAEQIIAAVPQIAGMLATMHPALRGVKASMLIPAATRGLSDYLTTGQLNYNKMVEDALLGLTGHAVGAGGRKLAEGGRSIVQRALDLGGGGYLNEVAEKTLPAAAIRENAKMTPSGVQALKDKFAKTGAGVYEDLAHVLEQAGLKSRNAPNITGGGLTTIIGSKLFPPETQLEIGKNMAKPFGLVGSDTLGQGAELSLRSLFAYLQSQLPGTAQMAQPQGPQRRSLLGQ